MNEIVKKNGISYGIILGVFSILITTLIYAIDISLFTSWWVGVISLLIYLVIGIVLVYKTKKQLNNLISFKEAFTVFFLAAVIGSTISVLFNIILFNVIDPSAKETVQQLTLEYTAEMMQKFGARASDVNEALAKMAETDNYSPLNQLKGLVFSFVFSAILGLILALIFKSKPAYRE